MIPHIDRIVAFLGTQWSLFSTPVPQATDRDLILKSIVSSKWRRTRIDDISLQDTHTKLDLAISENRDLEFSVPFGGYKSWRTESYPHINWAEVYGLQYLYRHGTRIASFFPGKITFTLSYCSGILDLVSNMHLEDQNIYIEEMTKLASVFSDSRVCIRLFDIASKFSNYAELRDSVLRNYNKIHDTWKLAVPPAEREKRINSARRNLVINGIEDLSALTESELNGRIVRSAMLCDALDSLEERRKFNKYSSRIQLVYVRGPAPPNIHIGSCDTSSNQFSVGTGAVEVRTKECLQRILTELHMKNESFPVLFCADVPDELTRGFVGLKKIVVYPNMAE